MTKLFETPRLSVRKFVPEDLSDLVAFRTDPRVSEFLGGSALQNAETLKERLKFYIGCYDTHGFGMSAVIWKESGALIGAAGLQPLEDTDEIEVAYSFAYPFWGKGLATECARAWLSFGFTELPLERIVAVAVIENSVSRRVLEKLGMRYEKDVFHYGFNCAYYAIEKEKFLSRDHG